MREINCPFREATQQHMPTNSWKRKKGTSANQKWFLQSWFCTKTLFSAAVPKLF